MNKLITMRKLTFILLALIVISCNSSSFKDFEVDLKYINNLKGDIKMIKSETFNASEKFGEPVKGELSEPDFDLSEYVNNLISPNSSIEFTKNGKLSHMESIKLHVYQMSHEITYNKKWDILEEYFDNNSLKQTIKYKREGNRIINSIIYDSEGNTIKRCDFQYDRKLIKKVTEFNNDGDSVSKVEYNYDNGILNESIYIDSFDDTWTLLNSSKTDIYGRLLELSKFGGEKFQIKYIGKNPFPSEIITFDNNVIDGKIKISLDNNKNISEIKNIDKNGETENTYKYVYKYDKKGNWIERTSYKDDAVENITIRTIEYY